MDMWLRQAVQPTTGLEGVKPWSQRQTKVSRRAEATATTAVPPCSMPGLSREEAKLSTRLRHLDCHPHWLLFSGPNRVWSTLHHSCTLYQAHMMFANY